MGVGFAYQHTRELLLRYKRPSYHCLTKGLDYHKKNIIYYSPYNSAIIILKDILRSNHI